MTWRALLTTFDMQNLPTGDTNAVVGNILWNEDQTVWGGFQPYGGGGLRCHSGGGTWADPPPHDAATTAPAHPHHTTCACRLVACMVDTRRCLLLPPLLNAMPVCHPSFTPHLATTTFTHYLVVTLTLPLPGARPGPPRLPPTAATYTCLPAATTTNTTRRSPAQRRDIFNPPPLPCLTFRTCR